MYEAYRFDSQSRVVREYNLLQPPLSCGNDDMYIFYLNGYNYLTTHRQFYTEVVHQVTRHRITAQTCILMQAQLTVVFATYDINYLNHVMVYDHTYKRLLNSFSVQQPVNKIVSVADSVILVAENDQTHCYKLESSQTTAGYQELFWTDAGAYITDIFVMSSSTQKVVYATVSTDNYIRVYTNEQLEAEIKPFNRVRLSKVDYFYGFFGILTEGRKFKVYNYQSGEQRFKILLSQDIAASISLFLFAFKPYARQLAHISNGSSPTIEEMVQVAEPLPFVLLYSPKHHRVTINFADLLDSRLVLRPLLSLRPAAPDATHLDRTVAEAGLFGVFAEQYVESFRLRQQELPFTAEQVRRESRQIVSFVGPGGASVFDLPFVFDFVELLQAIYTLDEDGCLRKCGVALPQAGGAARDAGGDVDRYKRRKKQKSRRQYTMELISAQQDELRLLLELQSELYGLMTRHDLGCGASAAYQASLLNTGQLGLYIDNDTSQLRASNRRVHIVNYALHFDSRIVVRHARAAAATSQPSNFEQYSDIVMNQEPKDTIISNTDEYGRMNYLLKQKFAMSTTEPALPLNNSQSSIDCFISYRLDGGSIVSQLVQLKSFVLPCYQIADFGKIDSMLLQDVQLNQVVLTGVGIKQLKIAFYLQNIVCQLDADFFHFRVRNNAVTQFIHEFTHSYCNNDVLCTYNQETQTMYLFSGNLRSLLNYCLVFCKSTKFGGYSSLKVSDHTKQVILQYLIGYYDGNLQKLYGDQTDLMQQNIFHVLDINNRIGQKQFDGIFNQYSGVAIQYFVGIKALYEKQYVNRSVIDNMYEILGLLEWNQEVSQKASLAFKNYLKGEGAAQDFVKALG